MCRFETVVLKQVNVNTLRVIQSAMKRSMLGMYLKDKMRNEEIPRKTDVKDIIQRITELKCQRIGHCNTKGRSIDTKII